MATPFKELPITTMTLVIGLDGLVNVDAIFSLLPITRLNLTPPKRRTQKFKIPFCGIPGAILSMRYRGATRGIVRSNSSDHFKNSITIDLCTKEKNLSIKLSSTGFHICGATSVAQGREGAGYIIDYVLQIQQMIDRINENPERSRQTLEWVKEQIKGPVTIQILPNPPPNLDEDPEDMRDMPTYTAKWRHHLNDVNTIEGILDQAPDPVIAQFFLRQTGDYRYYEDLEEELEWILTLQSVTSPYLALRGVRKVMVNYNYGLGFPINRLALARQIDGIRGFHARYNNAIEHSVTIELPYQPIQREDEDFLETKGRRKNKHPHHTFLVYRSGLVTQSGPDDEMMEEPYNRFIETIQSLRPSIEGSVTDL